MIPEARDGPWPFCLVPGRCGQPKDGFHPFAAHNGQAQGKMAKGHNLDQWRRGMTWKGSNDRGAALPLLDPFGVVLHVANGMNPGFRSGVVQNTSNHNSGMRTESCALQHSYPACLQQAKCAGVGVAFSDCSAAVAEDGREIWSPASVQALHLGLRLVLGVKAGMLPAREMSLAQLRWVASQDLLVTSVMLV